MTSRDKEVIGNYEVTKDGVVSRREVLLMSAMAAAGGIVSAQPAIAATTKQAEKAKAPADGPYVARDFGSLAKSMNGFSASQINQHLKLYNGYIAKSNELHKLLGKVDITTANATYSAVREMLVEQSYAHNGVIYHEYYFGNLGGKGGEPQGEVRSGIEEQWGSVGKFMDFLNAAGKSARGWVIVGYNPRADHIDAYALDTHNIFSPANLVPLVALDVYEHAYMVDFGIDRGKYLETFVNNIDWNVVGKRLGAARKHPTLIDSTR